MKQMPPVVHFHTLYESCVRKYVLVVLFALVSVCAIAQNTKKKVEVQGFVCDDAAAVSYVIPHDPAVREKLDKWQDLKFGVLFHWGIYAHVGIVESWSIAGGDVEWRYSNRQKMGMGYDDYKKWYFSLADQFNPTKFDPEQWATVMQDAGMKYMLFTAKHHDGFCMYDSKYTDFNIAKHAFKDNPKKDVMRHVMDAFRAKGFMVGPYFSKPDWHSDYYWNPLFPENGGLAPNYDPKKHPDWWQKFKTYTCNQLAEITRNYGRVDILWLDGGMRLEELGADTVVENSRKKYPGLICVDRGQVGKWENYRTPERNIPETKLDYPWETCATLNQWHWTFRFNSKFKSPRRIVNELSEIVAKGGCLALGVGPDNTGLIEDTVVTILHEIGDWLRLNGKAIYNTRATDVYNDGDTWFTASKDGKTLYAIYALPEKEKLPAQIKWQGNVPKGKMRLVSNGKVVKYKVDGDEVTVTLPKGMKDDSFALMFNVR